MEVDWDGEVRFTGVAGDRALERITAEIVRYGRGTRLRDLGQHNKLIEFPGGIVELHEYARGLGELAGGGIQQSLEDPRPAIVIEFRSNAAPFRSAQARFSKDVVHMLDRAKHIAQPSKDIYSIRVRYQGGNPYFGLYVRRLGLSSVINFDCAIREQVGGKDQRVTVRKDRLEIVADEIPAFNQLAIRHVAVA
jgi:hypothetical protein